MDDDSSDSDFDESPKIELKLKKERSFGRTPKIRRRKPGLLY
jgi:hypothetical protein